MARSIVLGNGRMLVGLDRFGLVRDFYFPYIGLENQVGRHSLHRVGVWADGAFSWLHDGSWNITLAYGEGTFEGVTTATNERLGVSLRFRDAVYNEKEIFIRQVEIENRSSAARELRLFFAHEFEPYESHTAHTAYFDPEERVVMHYKVRRAFAVNAVMEGEPFDDYTTGVFGIEGKAGSYKDAEDGALAKNPIEHGPADSVIGLYRAYLPGEKKTAHYWVTAAKSIEEACALNRHVLKRTPERLVDSTGKFWSAWAGKNDYSFPDLPAACTDLFRKSLFVIRAHANDNGAIIASSDSDMLQKGKDTYNYAWHRDGAYVLLAMSAAGYPTIGDAFFAFTEEVMKDGKGYVLHKYSPDGSLGSSWHPRVAKNGAHQLPIQEDETAILLFALWQHYDQYRNIEFVERVYGALVCAAANFLTTFREPSTGLPKPSYDLWEERYGIHTYTAASVVGGLEAAAKFADVFGKDADAKKWRSAAEEIRTAILKYLYDQSTGLFHQMITVSDGAGAPVIERNTTIDMASAYGIFFFGVLPPEDPRLARAMELSEQAFSCTREQCFFGLARYVNDEYYRVDKDAPGNPWIVTTLWFAQYLLARAKSEDDLAKPRELLEWAQSAALPSGILPEQVHPFTGEPFSATPLTWSHAEFVRTMMLYRKTKSALARKDARKT